MPLNLPGRFFFSRALVWGTLLVATTACAADSKEEPAGLRQMMDAAIARMKPALVRIHVVFTEYSEGREIKHQASGSGAIISRDGYIITNHHVAGHAAHIVCTLWDREEIEADLVGTDPLTDIAIIKLRLDKSRACEYAKFGDSSKLRVGDSVLAMGSPMALSQSVTLGILSNLEIVMPRFFGPWFRFKLDGEDVGALVRWIGHDAAIYPGNSGGPLVNMEGEIIGINEIDLGLSGAIPGNLAHSVADLLIEHGKVRRSWLGFDVQPRLKHSGAEHGVLISGVVRGSPAEAAGIQAGDLLLRLADTPVNVRFDEQMPDFMRLVCGLPIGQETAALLVRGGKEMTVRIAPIERGELNPPQKEIRQWGIDARNLSFLLAKELKRSSQDGVLVTSVRPGGPSGECKPALNANDVLIEINGAPVKSVADLLELTKSLTQGKTERTPVVATFERKVGRYLTVINLGVQELRDPGLEVTKAWLPVETQVISRDIARHLGQPDLKGFYVTQVYPDSTAEKAGLKAGDFIIAVDGEKLTASSPEHEEELATLIRQYDIGKSVELSLLRDKAPMKLQVELARSPKLRREMKKYRDEKFEFTARDIAFLDIAEEQWDRAQAGAFVEEVKPGSWAELGSLYAGDLILEVDGQPVNGMESLRKLMSQIAEKKSSSVVMKVQRGIHTVYLELEPSWKN